MVQAVKWDSSNLGVKGAHRRSGYFYGAPSERPNVWDVHWRGAIEKETKTKQQHQRRSQSVPLGLGEHTESYDVFLAHHVSQVAFANKLNERLQANGYKVYSNLWLHRDDSKRGWKANTSAWEKSDKPWRSSEAQHMSPARPTATGARHEEILLRECRCLVAVMTPDALESESFVREVRTARQLGLKMVVVHSFDIHKNWKAATMTANAILIPWEGGNGNVAQGVDGGVVDEVTRRLQLVGINANAYEGIMSPIGRNVGAGSPKTKKSNMESLGEGSVSPGRDGSTSSISVFPPIASASPAKGAQQRHEPEIMMADGPMPVHRMQADELQDWLTETLNFNPAIAIKFRGISGGHLCSLKLGEIVSRCHVTDVVAKKIVRSCKESVDPGMDTFLASYNRNVRATGGKMRRAADMTVDEVIDWAAAIQGLGNTLAARAKIFEALRFHGVCGSDLIEMDKHDFTEMGFCLADANYFLKECQTLKYHGIPPAYIAAAGSGPFG